MPGPSSSQIRRRRSAPRPDQPELRDFADPSDPRSALASEIPRRRGVTWWIGLALAAGFAVVVTPAITAERWLFGVGAGTITEHAPAPFTVRAPMLAGYQQLQIRGGVVIARGELASREQVQLADAIAEATPRGPAPYAALFGLALVLAVLFSHHLHRSTKGRLLRVQAVSLTGLAVLAIAVKALGLGTAGSALVVPVAAFAMVPTLVLDRTVGLATGVLAALVVSLLGPFDVGLAVLLLVQAVTAGLVIPERPRRRWAAALGAGAIATACTAATYILITYLTTGRLPDLADPLHAAWLAAALGPALAALITVPAIPLYQRLVGEITAGRLVVLEDLGHPLLRQIAERAPGTWQHSLMMANMAELAANAVGANGRLVRVGAYFHDLGKSLSPKYFIENLAAGETSPHDQLPPEVSADAIFAHVTEGIVAARKAGLHERIIDFMHMHHGNGVLEYFWARCQEQGNPHGLTIEDFQYPGHPPQSRETAILAIVDAVEAASRTLKKPEPAAIDALVQRIVYGKLHLGQLDDSGLSMADLRRITDSLRETIRHANHGRIEYPWQKAAQDASAAAAFSTTAPRLDSLDRKPERDSRPRPASAMAATPAPGDSNDALAATADVKSPAVTTDKAVRAARETETISLGPAERIERDPARAHAFSPIDVSLSGTGPAPVALVAPVAPSDAGRPVVTLPDGAPARRAATSNTPLSLRPPAPAATTLTGAPPPAPAAPAAEVTAPPLAALHAAAIAAGEAERRAADELDASVTEPSLPILAIGDRMRVDVPLRPPRTPAHPTAEVDPDDIEAAIELAPPARRPALAHTLSVARPRTKKPE